MSMHVIKNNRAYRMVDHHWDGAKCYDVETGEAVDIRFDDSEANFDPTDTEYFECENTPPEFAAYQE